jgi:hypothetical protein
MCKRFQMAMLEVGRDRSVLLENGGERGRGGREKI